MKGNDLDTLSSSIDEWVEVVFEGSRFPLYGKLESFEKGDDVVEFYATVSGTMFEGLGDLEITKVDGKVSLDELESSFLERIKT